jgi:hypothetical protein
VQPWYSYSNGINTYSLVAPAGKQAPSGVSLCIGLALSRIKIKDARGKHIFFKRVMGGAVAGMRILDVPRESGNTGSLGRADGRRGKCSRWRRILSRSSRAGARQHGQPTGDEAVPTLHHEIAHARWNKCEHSHRVRALHIAPVNNESRHIEHDGE